MRSTALHLLTAAAALALSACGNEPSPPPVEEDLVTPIPSGPPVVQQIEEEAEAVASTAQAAPGWELRDKALRLLAADGSLTMAIACPTGSQLRVSAPGFKAIGSEDRFSLGIGNEPVTLVAPDPMRQSSGTGVTAEGPMPGNFFALLKGAQQVSAMYGSQQIGPVPAPAPALASGFAEAC